RHRRIFLKIALSLLPLYGLIAYLFLPLVWKEYELQPAMKDSPGVTRTADGIPGDPINVGFNGHERDLTHAMEAAGWQRADPLGLETILKMGESLVRRRPDRQAPVSPLYLFGRREDLAFEKEAGPTLSHRNHVRFWRADVLGIGKVPYWVGSASFDRSVGFSRYTGQILHHIDPDLDAERNRLFGDLIQAGRLLDVYRVSGIGPTLHGRNGEGDWYYTDGEVLIGILRPAQGGPEPAAQVGDPASGSLRQSLWSGLRRFLHAFDIF
ncbi:MAG TPA: LssY C-terminal domain-containing protein, partial [bacterium]|nr:LssY C-terminal domain-containing protein [bacterium]